MATLTTVRFEGLTNHTNNSTFLAGSDGANAFQSSTTPYKATYQINFNNDSAAVNFYPTQGNLTGLAPADGTSYAAQYKISKLIWSLNKSVSVAYDNLNMGMCTANYHQFQNNLKNNELIMFHRILNVPANTVAGYEAPIVLTPTQSSTSGFVQFTINYFDKYIVPAPLP